jgi:hypothetical protein
MLSIQRRANFIPDDMTLNSSAPAKLRSSNAFKNVIDGVIKYLYFLSDDQYDEQLAKLFEIRQAIAACPKGDGADTLRSLKDAIEKEEAVVQTQAFGEANKQHARDRTKLSSWLKEALDSKDPLTHNSADWILNANKAKLYAVTPTGDSSARLLKGKKDPQKDEAWFPKGWTGSPGDIASSAVVYNHLDMTDSTNVRIEDGGKGTNGWNLPGVITITNPSLKSKQEVVETIRHEVQHDADKNKGRDLGAGIRAASEDVKLLSTPGASKKTAAMVLTEQSLQRYKTEYRAYSYQGSAQYDSLDNTVQNRWHDGVQFSERQLAIFRHIYREYNYVKKEWDNRSTLMNGRSFRLAVSRYWQPDSEGFNKLNSARVDDFYRALDAIGGKASKTMSEMQAGRDVRPVRTKESDPEAPKVKALLKVIDALEPSESRYLAHEAPQYLAKLERHLSDAAHFVVWRKLKNAATPRVPDISIFD